MMIAIPWLVGVALVIAILQSSLYRRYGLRHILHSRHFSEQAVYAGQNVELVERIENRKWLPLSWLQVESMFPVGLRFLSVSDVDVITGKDFQYHQSVFSLPPFTKVTRRHHITCLQRGVYGLQETTVTCSDLLGGQSAFQKFLPSSGLIVYPAILALHELPLPSHSWQGPITVRRWILPDPFTHAGTRAYQSGDSLRQVNWKATARTGELQVQKNDHTADFHLMIGLNFEVSEDMWEAVSNPQLIELGISYAATITQQAIGEGIACGFLCNGAMNSSDITNDERTDPSSSTNTKLRESLHLTRPTPALPELQVRLNPAAGQQHLHAILETMARLQMRCIGSFHTQLERDIADGVTATDYLLITAHQSARLLACKERLEALGNSVQWLLLTPVVSEKGRVDHAQSAL